LSWIASNFPDIEDLKSKYEMQVSSLAEAVHKNRNNLAHQLHIIKQSWDNEQ